MTFERILNFCTDFFERLLSFGHIVVNAWGESISDLADSSGVTDIPVLGWVADAIVSISFFDDVTLGALCLSSIALIFVLWIVRLFRQAF